MTDSATPATVNRTARTKSRLMLIVLVLVFFAPIAVAFLLYYGGLWRPAGNTHHGDLVHPPRSLPEIALVDPDGKSVPEKFLHSRWSLVYVGDGQCDARCRAALADIQRIRELLGKDISRVQAVFMPNAHCCADEFLNSIHPSVIVARVDTINAVPLLEEFPVYGETPLALAGRIYVIDPQGNLMMSYAADASTVGIYDDLKKLLKLSHIG